ncbi:SseB family protein [Rhodovulum euryhalinum]|uniref:Type III secretion system (T3SS) SseB-like protein n=1 Tax=Rhodovulum euryhalinum TaxID=35805 RepID=A0A4V2SB32_9RHOB|nr:SseB family protein [Rhodovulum euryhalinum]TCO73910.1 type III secretion system (T3SS) SseB-like protein [Rhodovulum euryhalinum]
MTDPTPLDLAHRALAAAPDDPAPRLRWYGALAAAELVVLLEREAEEGRLAPRVFALDEGPVVLAFDRESRLTDFTGAPAPYAALPGRALAGMLAGQGLGLGVNLGTEAAELLPASAVVWWAEALAPAPEAQNLRAEAVTPPPGLSEPLLAALDSRLAGVAGLASGAWLGGLCHADGGRGLLLAFVDARPGAEPVLARAIGEAVRFCGLAEAALDVGFVRADDPVAARLARIGLRIELPAPEPARPVPLADPDAPPRLR